MESEVKRLRVYGELPVIICEWHQHVLPHIHRGIASRHLPASGLKMLHFDAHPDLTFPINMCAADCFNKDALYDQIEIADWILPLCYEGHVNRIIWIKPQWADQIADGDFRVKVGEEKETGGLRVNWKNDYFIEELLYAKDDSLINAKEVEIKVETLHYELDPREICYTRDDTRDSSVLDDTDRNEEDQPHEENVSNCSLEPSKSGLLDGDFLLDIDLDFFSTYNPFKLHHSEEDFAKLTELYKFLSPTHYSEEQISQATTQRYKQLKRLQKTLLYFIQKENLQNFYENIEYLNLIDDINFEVRESEISRNFYDLLQSMKGKQQEDGKYIDLDLVHFAGMSSELPHHRSSTDEINASLKNVENFLLKQPMPRIITISRSTEDDYTPSDQVTYIQKSVIDMLTRLYGKISITKDYEK